MIILMRFVVSGHSMEPTFKPGQTLLVSSIPYLFQQPKVGDVVVVRDPRDPSTSLGQAGRLLLKRITKILPSHSERSEESHKFFVSGDNPKSSTDSRMFGPINKEKILGKVFFSVDK